LFAYDQGKEKKPGTVGRIGREGRDGRGDRDGRERGTVGTVWSGRLFAYDTRERARARGRIGREGRDGTGQCGRPVVPRTHQSFGGLVGG
jgi:hypothetical protein